MDYFGFYKSFYDRELQRRFDLDNSLNIPIGLVAVLIALASYIISYLTTCRNHFSNWIILIMTILAIASICIAIYYLALSYNDLFKGFHYKNYKTAAAWRDFQKELDLYNNNPDVTEKKDFEDEFINEMNKYTDDHIRINDLRQTNLRNAKSWIVASLILLLFSLIIVVIKKAVQ